MNAFDPMVQTFTLFWLDGKKEVVRGNSIATAVQAAGYGLGAVTALDFYKHGDATDDWCWSPVRKEWIKRSFHAAAENLKLRYYRRFPAVHYTKVDLTGIKSRWYARGTAQVARIRLG